MGEERRKSWREKVSTNGKGLDEGEGEEGEERKGGEMFEEEKK